MDSASAAGIAQLRDTLTKRRPNVVLVVVESWGLLKDPYLAAAVRSAYDDPAVRRQFQVTYGTVPFDGLTVPGEVRELCHSHLGFGLLQSADKLKTECLPDFFHQLNYRNVAVHGYVGDMFDRKKWYRELGFNQMWFKPQLLSAGLPECDGAFPGICDSSIAGWIGSSLLNIDPAQPKFIYWVTLNSHLPVPKNPKLPDSTVCSTSPSLSDSASLCSWFRLVAAVHEAVRNLALLAQSKDTVFILAGDHAPPFADKHLRSMFSDEQVPCVILMPRSMQN